LHLGIANHQELRLKSRTYPDEKRLIREVTLKELKKKLKTIIAWESII